MKRFIDTAFAPRGGDFGLSGRRSRQCKWGRPEGRPHSHRRVVLPEGKRLAPSAVAVSGPKSACRRCHRRSRRHPVPSGGWFGSEDPPRMPGGSETERPWWPRSVCASLGRSRDCAWVWNRECPADDRIVSRSSQATDLLPNRSSLARAISKIARTDAATTIRFEILLFFQSVRTSGSEGFSPSRCPKTAPRSRVAQARKPCVIHRPPFWLWTPVDKSTA